MAICADMTVRFVLLLLAVALFSPVGRAVSISGRSYTALSSWAAVNGFHVQSRLGKTMTITNRSARLLFEKNSHTAQINGVNVALSFPAAYDKGEMFVSQLDLVKTIEPLVFTPAFASKKLFTIVLDPGHGGKDTGNRVGSRFFGRSEKNYTLALAKELRDQLKTVGFNVLLTRTNDTFVELPARPGLANRRHADLFVSLHFNATEIGQAEVSGAETYCITPVGASSSNAQGEGANSGATIANLSEKKSLLLAYQIQKALVKNLGVEDRSVRRARFAVLRDCEMPSILVESGYMTHSVEGKKIYSDSYRRQIAAAIVKGIVNYQKLTAPSAEPAVGSMSKVSASRKYR